MVSPIPEPECLPPELALDLDAWVIGEAVDRAGRTWLHVQFHEQWPVFTWHRFHLVQVLALCDLAGWSTAGRWISVGDDGVRRVTQWFHPCSFDGQVLLHPQEPFTSFQLAAFGKKAKDLMMTVRDGARHCMAETIRGGSP